MLQSLKGIKCQSWGAKIFDFGWFIWKRQQFFPTLMTKILFFCHIFDRSAGMSEAIEKIPTHVSTTSFAIRPTVTFRRLCKAHTKRFKLKKEQFFAKILLLTLEVCYILLNSTNYWQRNLWGFMYTGWCASYTKSGRRADPWMYF